VRADNRQGRRLDSWKEVAAYLNRDVRTVQRWERFEGLPVHRHHHSENSSVYAFCAEIDGWRRDRSDAHRGKGAAPAGARLPIIGREVEVARLGAHLDRAKAGARQMVFVSGELGIGKTALVRTFVEELGAPCWVAEGQCIEQYGRTEPYLPVLDALVRLTIGPEGRRAGAILRKAAPSWNDLLHPALRGRLRRTRPTLKDLRASSSPR